MEPFAFGHMMIIGVLIICCPNPLVGDTKALTRPLSVYRR